MVMGPALAWVVGFIGLELKKSMDSIFFSSYEEEKEEKEEEL